MSAFLAMSEQGFSLAQKTLLIPVVSAANVSQLAVDVIIATWDLRRIGIFDSRDLIPVVGARESGEPGVTVPLELYGHDDLDFVVIQQRSPALKSRKQDFVDSILQFAQDSKIGAILFLSGIDLINRTDAQMLTPTLRLVPKHSPSLAASSLSAIEQLPIPIYASPSEIPQPQSQDPKSLLSDEHEEGLRLRAPQIASAISTTCPFIPGGGLTRRFLDSLPSSWSIPTLVLLQFVMEGDNRADAHLFASVIAKVLRREPGSAGWKQPASWEVGLFGSSHDQTLYG